MGEACGCGQCPGTGFQKVGAYVIILIIVFFRVKIDLRLYKWLHAVASADSFVFSCVLSAAATSEPR